MIFKNNLHLLWVCKYTKYQLCKTIGLKKIVGLRHPIRSKTKTNRELPRFPVHCVSYKYLLRASISSVDCL